LLIVALFALFAFVPLVRADDEDGEGPRLPVVGRPEFFDEEDGPIGAFETPVVQVTPRDVQVEDPVTVTIRVAAAAPVQRPPRRLRLEQLPGFAEQFYVEYPDDPTFRRIDDRTWEFTCTLKPKSVNVTAIPSFPFVFFTPGLVPPERGYQIHRTASISLVVRPRAAVLPTDIAGGGESLRIPASVFQVAEGPALLRHAPPWSRETLLLVSAIGFFVPPLACVVCCVVWRRRHPDAARAARWRRSHAAQMALAELGGSEEGAAAAGRAAVVVARYLQQRYDLPAAEPTPAEVGVHLQRAGCDAALAEQAASFFRACDAVRYAHVPPEECPTVVARQLVLTLEGEPCPAHTSC
jgi:hypothetical protein